MARSMKLWPGTVVISAGLLMLSFGAASASDASGPGAAGQQAPSQTVYPPASTTTVAATTTTAAPTTTVAATTTTVAATTTTAAAATTTTVAATTTTAAAATTTTLAPSFAVFPGGGQIAPGGAIPINVTNLCPNSTVTVTATTSTGTTTLGTGTANAAGTANFTVPAPAAPGNYIITVTSSSAGCQIATSQAIVVAAPTSTISGPLPVVGSEPMNWVRAGGIAILVGLGLIGAAAVRRRGAPAVG